MKVWKPIFLANLYVNPASFAFRALTQFLLSLPVIIPHYSSRDTGQVFYPAPFVKHDVPSPRFTEKSEVGICCLPALLERILYPTSSATPSQLVTEIGRSLAILCQVPFTGHIRNPCSKGQESRLIGRTGKMSEISCRARRDGLFRAWQAAVLEKEDRCHQKASHNEDKPHYEFWGGEPMAMGEKNVLAAVVARAASQFYTFTYTKRTDSDTIRPEKDRRASGHGWRTSTTKGATIFALPPGGSSRKSIWVTPMIGNDVLDTFFQNRGIVHRRSYHLPEPRRTMLVRISPWKSR